MRVKTNAGEVELTPEMVTGGMVFESAWAAPGKPPTGRFTITRSGDYGTVWFSTEVGTTCLVGWRGFCDRERPTFLGCDPTIASRIDCERFGVYGDALSHGFTKLRNGGALDLRRKAPVGSVFYEDERRFIVSDGSIPPYARFLGLNSQARKEDIEQICCGQQGGAIGTSPTAPTARCTLPICDHDTHEDLATGAWWRTVSRIAPRVACPECHGLEAHHHDHCGVARRTREATLVALVNAVPEGLNPIGWRAAVLAVDEAHPESDRAVRLRANERISDPSGQWLRAHVGMTCDLPDWSVHRIMHDAYHRAIATVSKVAPERRSKRAATLSIYLPDDDDLGW